MRRLISALSVLAAAVAAVLVSAAPAHAYEVHISITGAGQITETTPANLVGSGCVTSATNPTGQVGANCYPGDPTGDYGWGWTIELVATPKPGYRFVQWESDGTANPVQCSGGPSTHTGTTCHITIFDNLQTRAVFVDDTAPTMSSLSGPSQPVNGPASFTFSANADPTFRAFECRVAGIHDWQTCSSGHTENPPTGTWTLEVRAYDWSNNRSAALTKTWTVDKTAPNTTITGGPTGTVNSNSAQFSFTSGEAGSTFTCTLDGAPAVCVSPHSYAGLPDGQHTFTVAARDNVGNQDLTPATRTWTVDAVVEDITSPETAITSGPTGTVTSSTAEFAFTSNEPGSTFACTLDGSSAAPCTSPKTYTGLADGPHTFTVAATDTAGNIDVGPATRTWTVDTTVADTDPPQTTIDSGPSGTVNASTAQFAFSSTEAGAFTCSLDGAPAACTSPKSYTGLADGEHTFTVAATDTAGNTDPSPATRTWTVDTTVADTDPPETTITGGPTGTVNSSTAQFTFSSDEPGTFTCTLDGAPAPCSSPRSYFGLAPGLHTFTVAAADAAGNEDGSPAVRTWTVDTVAPRVISTKPSGKKVSRGASPRVLFSEAMRASSVTGPRFYLLKGTKRVAATVTYRNTPQGDHVAVLDPRKKLRAKQTYKVVVRGAVDLAGNPVRSVAWKFRTKR
jgi:hypothetical protein